MTLHLEDKIYNVLDCKFTLTQETDYTGQPCAKPNGGIFDLVIEGDKDIVIFEWVIDPKMMKNCKLIISSRYGTGKSRVIELLDCYCIKSKDHLNTINDQPYTISFSISPAIMINNGQEIFAKFWKKSDLKLKNVPITVREEEKEEKEVIDYYITDLNNIRLKKILAGDKILLNIHTKNMIDEFLSIKLDNQTIDFKYNGEILIDDTLSSYKIGSNIEKIELEAIKQQV